MHAHEGRHRRLGGSQKPDGVRLGLGRVHTLSDQLQPQLLQVPGDLLQDTSPFWLREIESLSDRLKLLFKS